MKRWIRLLITAVLLLALCLTGCSLTKQRQPAEPLVPPPMRTSGPEPATPEQEQRSEQYAAVLNALQAEDYDAAIEEIESMRPVPKVIQVEFDNENLYDYMEFTKIKLLVKDAAGEVTGAKVAVGWRLKDGYELFVDDEHPATLEIGMTAVINTAYGPFESIDYEALQYTGRPSGYASRQESITLTWDPAYSIFYYNGDHAFKGLLWEEYGPEEFTHVEDTNRIRVEGSLCLINNTGIGDLHDIHVVGGQDLVWSCPEQARAGERVEVETGIVTDGWVRGSGADGEFEKEGLYVFTMPDHDVELKFWFVSNGLA